MVLTAQEMARARVRARARALEHPRHLTLAEYHLTLAEYRLTLAEYHHLCREAVLLPFKVLRHLPSEPNQGDLYGDRVHKTT